MGADDPKCLPGVSASLGFHHQQCLHSDVNRD